MTLSPLSHVKPKRLCHEILKSQKKPWVHNGWCVLFVFYKCLESDLRVSEGYFKSVLIVVLELHELTIMGALWV